MTDTSAQPAHPPGSEEPDPRPVALVTGGARRVGRAIALALARGGCDLILTFNRSEDEAQQTATLAQERGARVELERLDLADTPTVDAWATAMAARLPNLDVLVHNASIYHPSPLDTLSAEDADRFWRVNALAPLLLSSRLAPALRRSARPGGASIVAMTDIHAIGRPRARFAPYSMSKAALAEMVRSLARDLAPQVRVNAVAPGVVAWPEEGEESDAEMQRAYLKRVPLARAGSPEDAAEAVRWLALDATYVTGQTIRIDGGRWLG